MAFFFWRILNFTSSTTSHRRWSDQIESLNRASPRVILWSHQFYPVLPVGHLLSIFAMIRSASAIASAVVDSDAGEVRLS